MGNIVDYFACANTADGLVNYFPSVLKDLEKVYILKGGPGMGKSTMMKKIGNHFADRGEPVEQIHCSSDPDSLDGVVLRNRKAAVVDGTAPHVVEPSAPGAVEEYVNLGVAWDERKLKRFRGEILDSGAYISEQYRRLYDALRHTKEVFARMEALLPEKDDAAQEAENALLQLLFADLPVRETDGREHHRFFAALTPEGTVHFWDKLTENCTMRCFLRGGSDLQKSRLLWRVAEESRRRGLETEMYHCTLNAERLDMVRIPEIGACVVDSGEPHLFYPERENDYVLDWNDNEAGNNEEEQGEILSLLRQEYAESRNHAKTLLYAAHTAHDALEKIYQPAVDFSVINGLCSVLIKNIESL